LHLGWSTLPATAELSPGIEFENDLPFLSAVIRCPSTQIPNSEELPLLIFFSTGAVYGEMKPHQLPFMEGDPICPIGWYAKGKAAAEELIRNAERTALPAAILRITNVYGVPDATASKQGVIPAIAKAVVDGVPLQIWGDGTAVKDYLHVRDLCTAVDAVLQKRLTGTFNVASGHSFSLTDILQIAQLHLGKNIVTSCHHAPAWDVQRAKYSNFKLRNATGWFPVVDFEDGLAETLGLWATRERFTPK
jgi:UDP-glucose 4-epimerase